MKDETHTQVTSKRRHVIVSVCDVCMLEYIRENMD